MNDAAIQLDRAALCLNCETVFDLSRRRCPSCDLWDNWILLEKIIGSTRDVREDRRPVVARLVGDPS